MSHIDPLITAFAAHADIGHLALLVWAVAATGMAARLIGAVETANRRFDGFVGELARFNARFDEPHHAGEIDDTKTDVAATRR
ncbi:MAG: hypothetical protein ACRCWO_04400 [Bosea sp. (in: a-proteobacteria)]